MECLGPQCAAMLLDWLKNRAGDPEARRRARRGRARSGRRPRIRKTRRASGRRPSGPGRSSTSNTPIFRRYQNQLTRAERTRLDNTIENVLFKMDRYLARLDGAGRAAIEAEVGRTARAGRAGQGARSSGSATRRGGPTRSSRSSTR